MSIENILEFENGNHENELLIVCEKIQSYIYSDETRRKYD